jgi:hypothetical protein
MQKYKIIELCGVLLGLASLILTFTIVPALILAPLGIIFNIITLRQSHDKRLGILGLILCIVSVIVAGVFYFTLINFQIGP